MRSSANLRPDLLLAGRTLFGAAPPKGQEFDDHYFGAIPERVLVYMDDVEASSVPPRHPGQDPPQRGRAGPVRDRARIFEAANVAADHQQMLMTVLKNAAKKHGFVCLLHEKPFAGINGSGKHVNWSIGNATQGNLLDPGDTPHENLQLPAVLRCRDPRRASLSDLCCARSSPRRATITASAPTRRRRRSSRSTSAARSKRSSSRSRTASSMARTAAASWISACRRSSRLPKDAGDRNRTSPFAFTGNRFEFRAVGSEQSVSGPLIAMNTILADSLNWIARSSRPNWPRAAKSRPL